MGRAVVGGRHRKWPVCFILSYAAGRLTQRVHFTCGFGKQKRYGTRGFLWLHGANNKISQWQPPQGRVFKYHCGQPNRSSGIKPCEEESKSPGGSVLLMNQDSSVVCGVSQRNAVCVSGHLTLRAT